MNEYIKKEDAIQAVENTWINGTSLCNADEAKQKIKNAPSADVVEVVRCEDCEHWKCNPNTDKYGACQKVSYDDFEVVMECDDFCSYGERREQEHD